MRNLFVKMQKDIELRGLSSSTKKVYLREVIKFINYYKKHPEEINTQQIKDYLYYIKQKYPKSTSTLVQVYSAIKFFYIMTLGKQWDQSIKCYKRKKKFPSVMSIDEIKLFLNSTPNIKYKAIFSLIYSSGLRISEAVKIKIKDINSKDMRIFIRDGKGGKDRYTILSKTTLKILKEYWKVYRPTEWLFPNRYSRKPMNRRSINRVFIQIKNNIRINNAVTVHTLRHSFATHLLEGGVDIRKIQVLLGHSSIRSTLIYLHISKREMQKVVSPLDMIRL